MITLHFPRGGILATIVLLSSCTHGDGPVTDIHSFSDPTSARTTHADIRWDLDFKEQMLRGSVTWTVARDDNTAARSNLVLDTKSLVIEGVRVGNADGMRTATYTHAGGSQVFGIPLTVSLEPGDDRVEIHYHTGDGGACVQWLNAGQTADNTHPFMFSQAQSINARAMIPCQDSPGVRFTFDAEVTAPDGIRPVMAAENLEERGANGAWRFRMPQPIPSYLLAIAAGAIEFKSMGPRTGVWAEPSVVSKAAWEFADSERMIEAAEKLYGPYQWGRYDIIILPPSFPFGGMENPRLTFATPTVLAGDRSLTALVAHELAHSWSGNLVTNATWSDFWLNEGFTVYFERRIMEAVYGPARAEMEAVLGRHDLMTEMAELPEGDTILHVDLEGRDPDDAFSNVPYEKGYLFLRLLDETYGRERFDPFLKAWFDGNAFQSRTTADFVAHLKQHLLDDDGTAIRLEEWLYGPGLPENSPEAESDAFDRCETLAKQVLSGKIPASGIPGKEWITHEWLHFLRAFPDDVPVARLTELDRAWNLTNTGNSEILMQWGLAAIRSGYQAGMPAVETLLLNQGRRKFLKPLYQELVKTGAGKARAVEIYRKARDAYHQIAVNTIDEILGWKQ
ncbi:MAG: M1 family metallopeptidase [Planctomycetes bacterium]|nr:M1 family metallopeptidase [Planctomycetota bacterium]